MKRKPGRQEPGRQEPERQEPGRRETEEQEPGRQERHAWLEALRQPLLRYCLQLTGSRWEAEDVVQDTMVRLLDTGTARPEKAFGFRYACRAARNLWIDRCRRAKRVTIIAQTDAAELAIEGGEVRESGYRGKAGGYEARPSVSGLGNAEMDVREHLEELAWRLPPRPFVILLLMEVFDFTAKETAEWLGGTEVAVQVALSRARSRLKILCRSAHDDGRIGGKHTDAGAAGRAPMPTAFFEAVLDAFHRRHPVAIQEAYLSLVASRGRLQGIRALGGKLYFTFQDPDGNVLMVSA